MLALHLRFEDGSERAFNGQLPVSVGRAGDCGLRLKAWRVARYHARFERRAAGIFLDDLGALSGTFVNGRRIAQYGPLTASDEIIIGPCLIRITNEYHALPVSHPAPANSPPGAAALSVTDLPSCDWPEPLPVPDQDAVVTGSGRSGFCATVAEPVTGATPITTPSHATIAPTVKESGEERSQHIQRLRNALLKALDLRRRDIANMSDDALRTEAISALSDIIALDREIPAGFDKDRLLRDVVDEAVGLGPLEPLLADSSITEIMVNRHDEIFVERGGRLHAYHGTFSSEQAVLGVIERIVAPLGRRIDESSPMVDARLRDGSRVNAVIPPIALRGASITIRKFPSRRPGMDDLLLAGALDAPISRFLEACVVQRKNLVVSGGTGSGKTTLLNILSNCIPAGERIVTIEDAAELQLGHAHLVALESRPANLEGRGAIPIRDLVRNALRMRPDRIIVGECRGAEAFDMLAAMNTGHEGSMTTLHANSPRDALSRLETMILMAGMDLPLVAVREHVASSIDIIVQQARLSSGLRVITSVVQVTGQESGRIQLQELFRYQSGPPAVFAGCGTLPEGIILHEAGLDIDTFNQHTEIVGATAGWQALH